MDAGQRIYFGYVGANFVPSSGFQQFVEEAIATGIEIDGRPMVRIGATLHHLSSCGETRVGAQQLCLNELVRRAGILQRQIDELRESILAATLMSQEAA